MTTTKIDTNGDTFGDINIELAYINYWHGGLPADPARSDECSCTFDYRGLVRMAGEDGRWPHLLVEGEGVNYTYRGGRGMWGAAEAMRRAGGPNYVPLPCTLPREWGDYAPVMFYDPSVLAVKEFWGDPAAPGWTARNRNLLVVRVLANDTLLHVTTGHGDINSALYKLLDAEGMRSLANDQILSAILLDMNETLSGPGYEPPDLNDPTRYSRAWKRNHRLRKQPGFPGRPKIPYEFATDALDFLAGYWNPETQTWVDGIGFVDACQQAGITTPTNLTRPGGPAGKQLVHILLNDPLAQRVVPGSVRVHEMIDPEDPDSDHKRLSATIAL